MVLAVLFYVTAIRRALADDDRAAPPSDMDEPGRIDVRNGGVRGRSRVRGYRP